MVGGDGMERVGRGRRVLILDRGIREVEVVVGGQGGTRKALEVGWLMKR